jgi:putative membrane protein
MPLITTSNAGRTARGAAAPEAGRPSCFTDRRRYAFIRPAARPWGSTPALIVVDWLFDSVTIGRWGSLLIGALVLTIGNAFGKPVLVIFTLPLVILTLGLSYFAINVAMLALAEWIAADFSIDGFWTYVGATVVVWLVNVGVGWLLDRVRGDQFAR